MAEPRSNSRRLVSTGVLALITAAAGFTMLGVHGAAAATPQTRYVSTTGDDGADPVNDCLDKTKPCATIQHAVDVADPGDTVSVAGGKYDESVHIRKSLTLEGAGSTGAGKTTIDGPATDSDVSLLISGIDVPSLEVTIANLDVSGNKNDGGVLAELASVTILDSVVTQNGGDGVELDDSTATATRSNFSSNSGDGIAVFSSPEKAIAGGNAVVGSSTLTASQIVVALNRRTGIFSGFSTVTVDDSAVGANDDGGVFLGGSVGEIDHSTIDENVGWGVLAVEQSSLKLTKSTVSNTTVPDVAADAVGPGFFGGGVVSLLSSADIGTSTISGNVSSGVLSIDSTTMISNSTIADTKSPGREIPGVGVVVVDTTQSAVGKALLSHLPSAAPHGASMRSGTTRLTPHAAVKPSTTLVGTITADNAGGQDCDGTVVDGGYNLASDKTCGFTATGSVNSGVAKLGTLDDNGGPTLTMLLNKGSQALDAIPAGAANCSDSVSDQRGVARPQPTGGKCDVGAVEVVQRVAPTPSASVSAASATSDPIAQTGSNVMPLTMTGGLAVVAGLVMLYAAGRIGRRVGRHRAG